MAAHAACADALQTFQAQLSKDEGRVVIVFTGLFEGCWAARNNDEHHHEGCV